MEPKEFMITGELIVGFINNHSKKKCIYGLLRLNCLLLNSNRLDLKIDDFESLEV